VAAGRTAELWPHRWSSAAYYPLGRGDPLVDANPGSRELSLDPGRRQQLWREFLRADEVREAEVRPTEGALGDDGFRRQMAAVHGRPVCRRRGRPKKSAGPGALGTISM
jgi:hypothetical protein